MTVLLAEHSGFCFGVRRAINMAREAKQLGADVCTLGDLIHNAQIVRELAEQGISSCPESSRIKGQTVVIRSHGISREALEELKSGGNQIVDATCPYVKRAQELVAANSAEPVFILGDPEHPEVRGILSYGNELTQVVQPDTPLAQQSWKTLSVVSQTTRKIGDLQRLVHQLLPNTLELKVFNTICSATTLRQSAAVALAKRSDLMIVIGDRNSSNTRMLQELCAAETRSVHIETSAEITPGLVSGIARIGLAAGASTPAETIVQVFNKIKEINGEADTATCSEELPLFKEESC